MRFTIVVNNIVGKKVKAFAKNNGQSLSGFFRIAAEEKLSRGDNNAN